MLWACFRNVVFFLIMKETGQAGHAEIEILSTWFISAEGFLLKRTREYFVPIPWRNETPVLLSKSLPLVSRGPDRMS